MSVLAPPFAFVTYIVLVGLLLGLGRILAGPRRSLRAAARLYSSGEAPPRNRANSGYGQFFGVALFFAVLNVGVLIASTGAFSPLALVYLAGLLAVLVVAGLG